MRSKNTDIVKNLPIFLSCSPHSCKYPVIWKHIFLSNKQVAQLCCSAGSIASYVTRAAAQRGGLDIATGMYVFIWLGAYDFPYRKPKEQSNEPSGLTSFFRGLLSIFRVRGVRKRHKDEKKAENIHSSNKLVVFYTSFKLTLITVFPKIARHFVFPRFH